MTPLSQRYPSLPYIAPFVAFMVLLAVGPHLPLSPPAEAVIRVVLLSVIVWRCARRIVPLRAPYWITSIALGIGVFALWIAPDVLLPAWRDHWLFANHLTGRVEGTLPVESRGDSLILILRTVRAVMLVPILEELFWRGWLPRWIDRMDDFRKVPLGSYSRLAFWVTAVLFASEHGAMWDVGLMAGLLYNWWMQRTRSLGDLILAHAVTNGCLSAYVLVQGRWNYW